MGARGWGLGGGELAKNKCEWRLCVFVPIKPRAAKALQQDRPEAGVTVDTCSAIKQVTSNIHLYSAGSGEHLNLNQQTRELISAVNT